MPSDLCHVNMCNLIEGCKFQRSTLHILTYAIDVYLSIIEEKRKGSVGDRHGFPSLAHVMG